MDQADATPEVQAPAQEAAEVAPSQAATTRSSAASAAAANVLMGVKLPIRILLGRTSLSLKDVANLGGGSIVELDRSPDDPVEIVVNNRVIARGEIVVVAGNYGIRITEIANREESSEAARPGQDLLDFSEKLR